MNSKNDTPEITIGLDGVIHSISPAASKELAISPDKLVGLNLIEALSDSHDNPELAELLRRYSFGHTDSQLELRNKLLFKTFGKFLSDEIVRQLLDTPNGLDLGGRKQTITLLMSDLRGFTAMSESMSAQRLIAMLNHYLDVMTEYIRRHNGTIIEFIGDGITVMFGAPTPNENHASDAVAAAIDMQAHMDEVNDWNKRNGYPEFKMGIGINTGEVIVGNIGCERHVKYGVVGSQVNLTARIESYTVGGQILISETAYRRINSELEVAGTQVVYPKGVSSPITLYDITGIGEPYCLFSDTRVIPPSPVIPSLHVTFRRIVEKRVDDELCDGYITALSQTDAVLLTASVISAFDNLVIDIGLRDPAGVKVIRTEKDGWLLKFTSLPSGFDSWLEDIIS